MKNFIYKLYKKMENNKIAATFVHLLYGVLRPVVTGKYKPAKYNSSTAVFQRKCDNAKPLKNVKIAVICDDMTYKNLSEVCDTHFLTPDNWIDVIQKHRPDIFFCESAWSGIYEYKDSWRGKIYKNEKLMFENRKVLFDILDYCRRCGIKTIFWNKEDPFYFDDECHNFGDTALKFDYIFTTAAECVEKYRKRGGKHVDVMGFGFSPNIFNCDENCVKENKAVFAGSWYAAHADRCADMVKIFDMIISSGTELEIYDRNYYSSNPKSKFPEKYNMYIKKPVPYEKVGEILKKVRFAVNINTIKNSETMFARRVYELMACKCVVISNESEGAKKIFGNKIWFFGEKFDFDAEKEIIALNYDYVMGNFTNETVFRDMLNKAGIKTL
ncbi:MAG: hypothetical protein HFE62_00910 [Firmicutes bacterium]|nr:hypothetical protein [Bacillota bacterium]